MSTPRPQRSSGRRDALSGEGVANISDRLDHRVAELVAQSPDGHVDHVAARVERIAPDLVEQLLARADGARTPHQVLNEKELARAELRGSPSPGESAPHDVELKA